MIWWSFSIHTSHVGGLIRHESYLLIDLNLLLHTINFFVCFRIIAPIIHLCLYTHWHLFIFIIPYAQEIPHMNIIIMFLTIPPSQNLQSLSEQNQRTSAAILRIQGIYSPRIRDRDADTTNSTWQPYNAIFCLLHYK